MSEAQVGSRLKHSWGVLWAASGSALALSMIRAADVEGFIGALPWQDWMEDLGGVLPPLQAAADAAVRAEMTELGAARITGAFDRIDVVAVHFAETEGARLIRGLTDAQVQAIRVIMAKALSGQYTVDQAALLVRGSIGLHARYAAAVARRWDTVYAKAIRDGLTAARAGARADRLATIYRSRLLASRAQTIARTEIQTAVQAGREAAWAQMIGSGNMSAEARKEWSAGPGACPICADLSGTVVAWDAPFPGGYTVPAHMNCRCTQILRPPQRQSALLQENDIDWLNPLQPAGPLFP